MARGQKAGDWFIIRTGARSTLGLMESLIDAGYDVWTPVERYSRRLPRSRGREDITRPLMPSFLFARAAHLHDLLALSHAPSLLYRVWDGELQRMVTRGHTRFTVFRQAGEVPMVADRALTALRLAEKRTAPRADIRTYREGDTVSLHDGGFAGLDGIVEGTQGQYTLVKFKGFPMAVKIATILLSGSLDTLANDAVKSGS